MAKERRKGRERDDRKEELDLKARPQPEIVSAVDACVMKRMMVEEEVEEDGEGRKEKGML